VTHPDGTNDGNAHSVPFLTAAAFSCRIRSAFNNSHAQTAATSVDGWYVMLCVTTAAPVNDPGSCNVERANARPVTVLHAADSLFADVLPRDSARRSSRINGTAIWLRCVWRTSREKKNQKRKFCVTLSYRSGHFCVRISYYALLIILNINKMIYNLLCIPVAENVVYMISRWKSRCFLNIF